LKGTVIVRKDTIFGYIVFVIIVNSCSSSVAVVVGVYGNPTWAFRASREVDGFLGIELGGDLGKDSLETGLPGQGVVVVEDARQSSGEDLTEFLEVFLLNSGADLVLVSQMVKSGLKHWWVIQEVDGHVECVEDTNGVGREIWSLRMLDVDSLEELCHFGDLLGQLGEEKATESDLDL